MSPLAMAAMLVLLANSASASEVDKGHALATRLCAVCHLQAGQGEKTGPETIPGFAAVANRPRQTFEDVVLWLGSRPAMMPDHRLTQAEAGALAAFIMSLRKAD